MEEFRNEKKLEDTLTQMLTVCSEGKMRYGKGALGRNKIQRLLCLRMGKCKWVRGLR